MNHDAYLTGSTTLQHLCHKLHSRRAIPSLSVAGPSVQTALIIRAIGQSAAISDTATKDNEGRSTPVYLFQAPCRWLFKLQTFLSQHISPDQPRTFFFSLFFFRIHDYSRAALWFSMCSWFCVRTPTVKRYAS